MYNRYHYKENEAHLFSEFILPMLEFYPEKRISAQQSLRSNWLKLKAPFECKMSDHDFQLFLLKSELVQKNPDDLNKDEKQSTQENVDSDAGDADHEDNDSMSADRISDEAIGFDRRFIDRSFAIQKYGYFGYGDGIHLEELDVKGNWQFD